MYLAGDNPAMFAHFGSVTFRYAIEKHARVPNEPFDAEEDAANFEVDLVDCSSFSVFCKYTLAKVAQFCL